MARTVELTSTSDGRHRVCFSIDNDELSNFSVMMYITHYGKRAIDWIQSLSLGYCTFMGGDLWIHNSDKVGRDFLFGEQKDSVVSIIANQEPHVIKLLDSIGIHTDGQWSVESVTIPHNLNYPNGQFSKIPYARFKRREGILQAEFLRNMKTTSNVAKTTQAISGEPLRGNTAYIELKNTSTGQVRLYEADINMSKTR
jgi:hypothetical protein